MSGRILTSADIERDRVVRADAVVVGSGAGGAVTAWLLCEAGKHVVVLEEGSHHTTASFTADIPDLLGRLYRGAGLTPIVGRPNIAYAEGRCLGGSTVINGGLFMRPPERLLQTWARDRGLASIDAESMEPHFARLEDDLSVATQPDTASNQMSWKLARGAEQLGWRVEHTPRAQAACKNSNRCPTGCPTGAKQSMLVSYLPRAAAMGASIYCDSRVNRIRMDGDRARGVEAVVEAKDHQPRRLIVEAADTFVCGGVMQTPFLLRGSGIDRQVGRDLRIHLNLKVVAVFADDIDPANGTIMTAQVREFADRDIYIGGSNFDPVYVGLTLAPHGPDVVGQVLEDWRRVGLYVAQIKGQGRGRVRRAGLVGRPIPTYELTAADMENVRIAILRIAEVLLQAGAERLYLPIEGSPPVHSMGDAERIAAGHIDPAALDLLSVHAMGSCPLGTSVEKSTLDPFGRVWNTRNLYVNDASMLPGATGVSPQMTIMAVAMRNALAYLAADAKRP